MPTLNQVAREVILKNWPIGDDAFDAIWTAVSRTSSTAPADPGGVPIQSAFAATGAKSEPAAIAVAVFVRVLEELVEATTLEELLPHLERISGILGNRGIGQRLKATCIQSYSSDTLIAAPPAFAYAYSHNTPNGKPITQSAAAKLYDERAIYAMFMYHEANLPIDTTGKLFLHKERQVYAQSFCSKLPPRHYRILLLLLTHRERDAERSLAALVESCWGERSKARQIRPHESLFKSTPSKYRTTFTRLSQRLQAEAGIAVRTEKRNMYALIPWPETYCVVEEQQNNPTQLDARHF